MKILVITHSYKPHNSPRALRWSALLEKWAQEGHQIQIVTGHYGEYKDYEQENLKIYPVKAWDDGLRSLTTSKERSSNKKTTSVFISLLKIWMKKPLKFIYNLTWKNLIWPDYTCLWMRAAYKKAHQLVQADSPDVLLSVSHPFSAHVVAYRLNKKFSQIKWKVDIGDPFYFLKDISINNRFLYNGINHWVENKILKKCDGASVTTQRTLKLYEKYFPEARNKFCVMGPLLRDIPLSNENSNTLSTSALKFYFIGRLYKKIRSPQPVLEFFFHLIQNPLFKNCELYFVGGMNDCEEVFEPYKSYKDKNIFIYDFLPSDEVKKCLNTAHILVNIGNTTDYQLPSKVIEYVAMNKPILNFHPILQDSSVDFFKDWPLVHNINSSRDFKPSMDWLIQVIQKNTKATSSEINDKIKNYTLSELSQKYRIWLKN